MFSDVDRSPDPDRALAYLARTAASLAGVKRALIERLRVEPGERILDIGCGAGHDLEMLTARGADAIGIDSSVRMAQESSRRCQQSQVVVGDAAALSFASDHFDACRIERVLQHVRDPLAVLEEAARVLRRGGRLVVFEPDWASLAIDSDNRTAQAAITKAVMLGARHPRVGLQLRDLLVRSGFAVGDVLVDVGRYASMAALSRGIDFSVVCSRAVAAGWLQPGDVRSWNDEMNERSSSGRFQATLNRMIAIAHA